MCERYLSALVPAGICCCRFDASTLFSMNYSTKRNVFVVQVNWLKISILTICLCKHQHEIQITIEKLAQPIWSKIFGQNVTNDHGLTVSVRNLIRCSNS